MIGTVLTLKQLEALVRVAELGSFRKAAAHLNTTQPNISSRIAALERRLGTTLMQRDAGSVRLTGKGREIVAAAHAVLRDAERIVEIAGRRDLVADRLRLGVTELVACTWLHAYLRRIKAAYPALNIELTVDLSRHLDGELTANRLDLAIQTAPFASPASGVVELGAVGYVWVAAPAIARALNPRNGVADLLAQSVLTHARHTQAHAELLAHVERHGLPTTRLVASSSLASCVQMAADGMGVTLLPESLVTREVENRTLVQVEVDWTPSPLRFAARYQAETAPLFLPPLARCAAKVAQGHAAGEDKEKRSPVS